MLRPRVRTRRLGRFGCATAFLLATSAPAETETVAASLELVAPDGCGNERDLASRILRRSERIRIETGPAPRALSIAIRAEGQALVVSLELLQPSGRRSSRTLRAPSCDEALEAAALVAALSLDPAASTAPESELVAEPGGAGAKPANGTEPSAPRVAPEPAQPDEGSFDAAPARESRGFTGAVALGAAALWAPAPDVLPGLALSALARYETGSLLSPALRLTYAHFGRGGFEPSAGVGSASVVLDEGTVELCPLRLGSGTFNVAPCPFASGGRLQVIGSEAAEARSHSRPWWVLGGSLLAFFRAHPFELQGSLALGIPLIRDTYQFDPGEPDHVVHHVSPVAIKLGLSAGLAFR